MGCASGPAAGWSAALIAPPAADAIASAAAPEAIATRVRRLRWLKASSMGQVILVWISRCSGRSRWPARSKALRVASLPRQSTFSSMPQAASRMDQPASSA